MYSGWVRKFQVPVSDVSECNVVQ